MKCYLEAKERKADFITIKALFLNANDDIYFSPTDIFSDKYKCFCIFGFLGAKKNIMLSILFCLVMNQNSI